MKTVFCATSCGAGAEVGAGPLHQIAGVLQRGERAVPFVEVQAAPVDASGAQRADAAHAQQQLLPDADPLVAEVEPGGQLAVLLGVPLDVGVEQQEPVAPDGDLPDLRQQRLARERHFDDDRLAERSQGRLAGSSSAGERTYSACCQPSRPMCWRKYDSR